MLVAEPESTVAMKKVREGALHTFRGRPVRQGTAKTEVYRWEDAQHS